MLVIMAGLPGTGKSTLAREIALRTNGVVLDKDCIRAALFGSEVEYSTEQDDFVVNIMLQTAAWFLARDRQRVVIIDGRVFSRNAQLQRITDFASKLGVGSRVLECVCSEATARQRLETDIASARHIAANRSWELYEEIKQRFEPIPPPKAVIDTDRPLDDCITQALTATKSHPSNN